MRSLKVLALLAALNTVAWMFPQEASAQRVSVSFQLFYDELSPHGMWVDYPHHGYVWIPNEDPGFSPYATAGHWVFTDEGWMWISDYPWGWAPFHYGRWGYDDVYGWYWVPDNEWGPAWVSWRSSPGYYGWAPLRPGISITMVFGTDYRERNEDWIFVREGDITRSDIGRRYINRRENGAIINRSSVIRNTRRNDSRNVTYTTGPNRDDVQKATRTKVQSVTVRENDRPGHQLNKGELRIYRPQVERSNDKGRNPAPANVMNLKEVRPASERNSGNRQQGVRPDDRNPKDRASESRNPPASKQKDSKQRPATVNQPGKDRSPQPMDIKSSNRVGKDERPMKVTQPKKDNKPQPSKAGKDEKRKGKPDQ